MENELEKLSKNELISQVMLMQKQQSLHQRKLSQSTTQIRELNQKLVQREEQITVYKRLIFGARRERYITPVAGQMSLPFEATDEQKKESEARHTRRIEYTRRKAAARKHPGRVSLPDHLPVEEVIIDPPGDLSDKVCIGRLVTDKLEMIPAKAFIKRYIRNKYVDKNNPDAGVLVGDLPDEVSDKSIAGPSVMAQVIADKHCDHLPLHRQQQRFSRHGIIIASSTMGSWVQTGGDKLQIFYGHYIEHTKSQGYLQIDETPIPVLESKEKGKTHKGYYWVYYSPLTRTVLFDYHPGRGRASPSKMLDDFTGYMQTDGYAVYDQFGRREGITQLGCWAHARRYFERALDTDRERAGHAMELIQELYAIERQARQGGLSAAQRKALRGEESVPILNDLGKWVCEIGPQTHPESAIGKAMYYAAAHWKKLNVYVQDGNLEIDNNLVENQIRPIAVGYA